MRSARSLPLRTGSGRLEVGRKIKIVAVRLHIPGVEVPSGLLTRRSGGTAILAVADIRGSTVSAVTIILNHYFLLGCTARPLLGTMLLRIMRS